MDRDNASFERAVSSLEEAFGRSVVSRSRFPSERSANSSGLVNILTNKAYRYERDGSGKFQEIEIPADLSDEVASRRDKLIEMVAEASDDLMEKFFAEGTLDHGRTGRGAQDKHPPAQHRAGAVRELIAQHRRRPAAGHDRRPAPVAGARRQGGRDRPENQGTRRAQDQQRSSPTPRMFSRRSPIRLRAASALSGSTRA